MYLVGALLMCRMPAADAQAEMSCPIQGCKWGLFCVQGMSLVPAVTELLLAELLYLQYDNPTRPIFMYINSAGVQVRTTDSQAMDSGSSVSLPMDVGCQVVHAVL